VRVAAVLGLALVVLLALARGTALDGLDRVALEVVAELSPPSLTAVSGLVLSLADPRQALLLGAATVVVVALVGARPAAVAAVLLLVAANGLGLLLDGCCERVVTGTDGLPIDASAPSNHVIAVASCAAALGLAVPRPLLGAVVAVAVPVVTSVAAGVLLRRTHAATDVLASLLLVAALARAAAEVRLGAGAPLVRRPGLVLLAAAAVVAVVLALLDPASTRLILAAARADPLPALALLGAGMAVGAAVHRRR
jgi:membrane-associated phospholipid phosphatase